MDLSGIRESLSEIENPPKKVCAVCQAPADKSCGACYQIDYCSAEHQKSHWKEHKKDCSPIRIVNSPELGFHFVATRDLPPGTALLTELPILALPGPCTINNREHDAPSCISCRSNLPSAPWACSKCTTPLFCNAACSMSKAHSEFECGVLSKCSEEERVKLCIHPNLMYLRAIGFKNRDPGTWTKVLELHGANQYKPEDATENDKWFIREILPLLGDQAKGFEADMTKLKGILQQREIVDTSSEDEMKGESHMLYLKGGNFARSCFPNSILLIGKGPQFKLLVLSTARVSKGSTLTIDYLHISSRLGVMSRQHLAANLGTTLCICPRCSDPSGTELGTMLSAVKCTQPDCQDGYLLPVDVKDMAENAPWRCNRSGCNGNGKTWEEINGFIKELVNDMNAFLPSVPLQDVKRTAKFLDSLRKKLHPNHYRVIYFEFDMIYQIDLNSPLSLPHLRFYFSLIEDILRMAEYTLPGLNPTKAYLWEKYRNLILNGFMFGGQEFWPKELKEEFKRLGLKATDQFYSIAKFYPGNWPAESFEDIEIIRSTFQPEF